MKRIKLDVFRDEMTGETGLGIKGLRRDESINAAREGALIAHDLIEHVNGVSEIGSIDDEMEALGAIWYVRGQHDDLVRSRTSIYSAEQNIASDFVRMFRDHIYGQHVSYVKFRTKACDHDEAFNVILDHSEREYLDEIDYEDKKRAMRCWYDYREVCLHRMRIGYRKAYARWERKGPMAANQQFWAIAEAVNEAIRFHELYEGAEFNLQYGNGRATCDELMEDFE